MKKIIRIASVIALACASLVYVGCTKDFSADIAKTNSDVSALKSKVDALDATVQTINSTVANLQTTKADVTYVDAADKVLGGKIDDLTAELAKVKGTAEQAVADAAKANEAAAKVAEDLKNAKAELDTIIAGVNEKIETLEVNTDSLRKDVDSLYKNSANFSKRIDELEGRVNAIAARITSIVAVPSTVKEFVRYQIDTCTVKGEIDPESVKLDTTLFQATFAITPKAAAANIKPADVKVVVKEGLTKGQVIYQTQTVDTTLTVKKVIAEDGAITVVASGKSLGEPSVGNKLYYSLVFNGKDAADSTYEQSSQFVAAANGEEIKTLANSIVFAPKEGSNIDFVKVFDNPSIATLTDTLAFNGEDGLAFGKLFDNIEFKFQVNGNNLTPAEFADMIGVNVKNIAIKADTGSVHYYSRRHPNYIADGDTAAWNPVPFKVTSNGTTLVKPCNDKIGFHVTVAYDGFHVGKESVTGWWQELHYIGAKTEAVTLPATSEAWTYSTWNKITKTVSLTSGEAAKKAAEILGDSTYTSGKFSIKKISANGVDIKVDGAARNVAAKDTTYNVQWTKKVVFAGEDVPNDKQDSINFVINWAYTLKARPADAAIDLGSKDTVATKYSAPIAVPVKNAIDLTFAEFAKAYSIADANDTAAIKLAIKEATPALDSVICDGKSVSGVIVAYDNVTFPATTKAGDYTVYFHSTVFGIKYSYTFVAQISRPTDIKLHATPYVSDGVAIVDADTSDTPYSLNEMFFAKYIQVWSADSLAKGFEDYSVQFKAEIEDSSKFAYEKDTNRGEVKCVSVAPVTDGTLRNNVGLEWHTYKGREVKITATLVSPANDTIDAYEFTLKYQKPITSFKAGTQEVTRVAGQNTEVTLSKSFEVKGLYHGDKNIIVDTTGRFINMKNYYDIEFEYDKKNAIFKVNGVETKFVEGVDYILKSEGVPTARQTITFIGDNNNKNIEANIPVILKYKYDYNHVDAYTDNLIIKVK